MIIIQTKKEIRNRQNQKKGIYNKKIKTHNFPYIFWKPLTKTLKKYFEKIGHITSKQKVVLYKQMVNVQV
jgi:hypothetical protein